MSSLLKGLVKFYNPKLESYKLSKLILEQEEEAEEESAPAEEEAAEEDAADEDESGDQEGEDTEEAESDQDEPEDSDNLETKIDADIEAVFIDFESEARKNVAERFIYKHSISLLYEEIEDDKFNEIDLDHFTGEVARLVKNYETLLDMETMLVNKAKDFITTRYGEDAAATLEDKLATQHDIEVESPRPVPTSNLEVPVAVGAASGEAVGE